MNSTNKIMLITYADSLGGSINAIGRILDEYFSRAIGGIHILPFFPSSADRGFAPMCYDKVDDNFGTFEDVKRLSEKYYLMFDFMVNHISKSSVYFQDFLLNKETSPYKDFFILYKDFWKNGQPTQEQVDLIYKRKPRAPYVDVVFADGSTEKVWCTFCEEQIDLDITKKATLDFVQKTLRGMCENGASIIRLDAFAYAIKKPDTECFFIEPDIWNLLHEIEDTVKPYQVEILPEIHEHYRIQQKIAGNGFWIYDFALPVLVLHALYEGEGKYLKKWLEMSPKRQYTTLDTHDGIGIVDVKDLLPDSEIEKTREHMFTEGANVKKIYNTTSYNNLDIYQINATYYSALGNADDSYLLARSIQFFAPGIPQVYYVGLLAGENDIALMESTKNGRDINRHSYSYEEIEKQLERPVVKKLRELMILRNTHPAFAIEGDIEVSIKKETSIIITRKYGDTHITLSADLKNHSFFITDNNGPVSI